MSDNVVDIPKGLPDGDWLVLHQDGINVVSLNGHYSEVGIKRIRRDVHKAITGEMPDNVALALQIVDFEWVYY